MRQQPEVVSGESLPGYEQLDVHLAWQVTPAIRVTLVGQNLLNDEHIEFGTAAARGPIARRGYLKLGWKF